MDTACLSQQGHATPCWATRGNRYGGLYIYIFFCGKFWISFFSGFLVLYMLFLLLCFSAFCFSCFSACLLFCFLRFLLFAFPASLLFRLLCFAFVLLCLSTSTIPLFLFFSHVFLLLYFLLLCFSASCLYGLSLFFPFCFALISPSCILNETLKTLGETQRNPKEILIRTPDKGPQRNHKLTLKKPWMKP